MSRGVLNIEELGVGVQPVEEASLGVLSMEESVQAVALAEELALLILPVEEQILGVAVLEDLAVEGLASGIWCGVLVEEEVLVVV